jgi:hypothetical protein
MMPSGLVSGFDDVEEKGKELGTADARRSTQIFKKIIEAYQRPSAFISG